MTILGLFVFYLRNLSGQKPFFSRYGRNQNASRPDGHQYVFPNDLWTWDHHWYFFNLLQVKFYIEVNMNHIQLHNEDLKPKAYGPSKQCSPPMSTVAEPSMRGGTMKWTRSELWRQQCASKGRTFTGWYIADNPKMIVHIMWSPWQPEWCKLTLPAKFFAGKSKLQWSCLQPT